MWSHKRKKEEKGKKEKEVTRKDREMFKKTITLLCIVICFFMIYIQEGPLFAYISLSVAFLLTLIIHKKEKKETERRG